MLPSTPAVLSIGRRCVDHGYGFYWRPFSKIPEFITPDREAIPITVVDYIPYYYDHSNLALKEKRRTKPVAVPSAETHRRETTSKPQSDGDVVTPRSASAGVAWDRQSLHTLVRNAAARS